MLQVSLTRAMARMLAAAQIFERDDVAGNTNTISALIDRGLVVAGPVNLLTDRGRDLAKRLMADPELRNWARENRSVPGEKPRTFLV